MSVSTLRRADVLAGLAASLVLVGGTAGGALPFSQTEVFGFLTGGAAVWLVVKQNIWNWPVGIVNNVLFIVLFWQARLFADMGLQWVYVAISIAGWWYWLRGGAQHSERPVGRAGTRELIIVLALVALATLPLTAYLRSIDDSAPFLDALTTALSLGAMYLMARKLVENWWLWIAADIVYIPLYVWKQLPLTGLLYTLFLAMCVRGLADWRRECAAS
jgi:nicotinamide mononucleotide transporter